MQSWRLLVALVLFIGLVSVRGWLHRRKKCTSAKYGYTHWRQHIRFQCPKEYQSISEIRSIHDNCKEDRSWHFKCAYNPAAGRKCFWSQWANDHDHLMNFHCPHEGFITGLEAVYDGRAKDRRFKFRCCHLGDAKFIRRDCHTTHYMNNWDGDMAYFVPQNYYLSGVTSIHDNRFEDRRWQFEYCKKFSTESCDYKREIEEDFKMIEKRKLK